MQKEVKHNILGHQPERLHITTSCGQVVREDAGLEVKKGMFSSKNQRHLWLFVPNYEFPCKFPLLPSLSAPHSNMQHISYFQQEQTSHQAQQLHCLKSTDHEGLNKKSVSISVPTDREEKEQDQRWYFKQEVVIILASYFLVGETSLICRIQKQIPQQYAGPLYDQKKNCSTEAECSGSYAGHVGIVHQYVPTYTFRQVRLTESKGKLFGSD